MMPFPIPPEMKSVVVGTDASGKEHRWLYYHERNRPHIPQEVGREMDKAGIVHFEMFAYTLEAPLTSSLSAIKWNRHRIWQDWFSGSENIAIPPGSRLRTASEFLFSRKTLEHVIDPIIADMQAEYCQALAAKRPYKATWVLIRGYWSFAKTVGLYSILKTVIEMWRKVSSV